MITKWSITQIKVLKTKWTQLIYTINDTEQLPEIELTDISFVRNDLNIITLELDFTIIWQQVAKSRENIINELCQYFLVNENQISGIWRLTSSIFPDGERLTCSLSLSPLDLVINTNPDNQPYDVDKFSITTIAFYSADSKQEENAYWSKKRREVIEEGRSEIIEEMVLAYLAKGCEHLDWVYHPAASKEIELWGIPPHRYMPQKLASLNSATHLKTYFC